MTIACIKNNKNLVDYLVKEGINDFDGGLETASTFAKIEMVEYMIDYGATSWDMSLFMISGFYDECKNKNECTCGGDICKKQAFDIMNLLFSHGAVIDIDDYYDHTQKFYIQFDCLYEITTIKQYKQRLENMQKLERLGLSDDINDTIQKYF